MARRGGDLEDKTLRLFPLLLKKAGAAVTDARLESGGAQGGRDVLVRVRWRGADGTIGVECKDTARPVAIGEVLPKVYDFHRSCPGAPLVILAPRSDLTTHALETSSALAADFGSTLFVWGTSSMPTGQRLLDLAESDTSLDADSMVVLRRVLDAAVGSGNRLRHRYLVGAGWIALGEVTGAASGLGWLQDLRRANWPPLEFATKLADLEAVAARELGDERLLPDVDKLRRLGAPVPPNWTYRDHALVRALRDLVPDEAAFMQPGPEHDEPIRRGGCGDESIFDLFGDQTADEVLRWAATHLPPSESEVVDAECVRVPTVRLLEPSFVALHVEVPDGADGIAHVTGSDAEGRASTKHVPLDGRGLLLPVGVFFSQPDSSDWESEAVDGLDPTDESQELQDTVILRSTIHDPDWFVRQRFVGPSFIPSRIVDGRGRDHDLRPPYARECYERVSGCWMGMSCPEVFVRHDGGPWRYIGPILAGAEGPDRRRKEEISVPLPGGAHRVEVILREVSGEIATITASLAWMRGTQRVVSDHVGLVELSARNSVRLTAEQGRRPARLVLSVDGHFVRVPQSARHFGMTWGERTR